MLWEHWAGYLVPQKYQHSATYEYYAIRNSVGIFDTSPLFKYRIKGPDATKFLAGVLTRDVRKCKTGRGQYTVWCDDQGWILEDGVVLPVKDDEYWLTAAEPNLRYLQQLAFTDEVEITDISEDYGVLAIQGPNSLKIFNELTKDAAQLNFFDLTETKIANKTVILSRTGYTGDLGYEVWVKKEDALDVWDAIMEAGKGYNITPFGQKVLHMARIDAGLLLIGIEFETARHAWTDEQRATPIELGFSWMLRRLSKSDRQFLGRKALEKELAEKTSRWKMVGIEVDWQDYEKVYNDLGMMAPKCDDPVEYAMTLYQGTKEANSWIGHTTSFMFSPILKKHIALARVKPEFSALGTELLLELTINHKPRLVKAKVVKMPFFNPPRKTAKRK